MIVYLVNYRIKTYGDYTVPVGVFKSEVDAVAAIHDDWQELETSPHDYEIIPFTLGERTDPGGKVNKAGTVRTIPAVHPEGSSEQT